MRAGQVLVNTLGQDFSFEILPSLREGMFAEDSRIRLSSITLLGDLLYLISDTKAIGMSSNADGGDDDEDIVGADAVGTSNKALQAIRNQLGSQVANTVFASLYIVRSDVSNSVRHMSLQVWKSVITNTPRTLLEIVEELVHQAIEKLSSESDQLRLVAGKALGEVVRKMGDRVLPIVMPLLQQDLHHPDVECRQGVCLGLSEILSAITTKQIEDYLNLFIHALQVALSDEDDDVRNQAAKAFQILHKTIGLHAVEAIVPPLLTQIMSSAERADGEYDRSFLALKELVQVRPRDLLEYLLPKLIGSSTSTGATYTTTSTSARSQQTSHTKGQTKGGRMTISAARVLGAIASACSHQLMYHFQYLVSMFTVELNATETSISNLQSQITALTANDANNELNTATLQLDKENSRFEAIKMSIINILTVVNTTGITYLITELGSQIEHENDIYRRRWGCWMLQQFLLNNKDADYLEYIPLMLRYILNRIVEFDTKIIPVVIDTFSALVASAPLDELMDNIEFMKNCISSVISDIRHRTGMQHIQYIKSKSVTTGTSGGSHSHSKEKYKEYMVLPLFSQPKAIEPFLTVFLHGLLNGNIKTREISAECITDIISYVTDSNLLKPYYIKTTGPLIRVLGERFPSEVKAAILLTLIVLLEKGSVALKPFAPQLQTTFVKNLTDSSKIVRTRAVNALGLVVSLSLRIDPLLNELCTLYQTTGTNATASTTGAGGSSNTNTSESQEQSQLAATQASYTIKSSILSGIYITLKQCGSKALPASLDKVKILLLSCLLESSSNNNTNTSSGGQAIEDETRWNIAKCYSALTCYCEWDTTKDTLTELLNLSNKVLSGSNGTSAAIRIMSLAGILQSCVFMGFLPSNSNSSSSSSSSSTASSSHKEVVGGALTTTTATGMLTTEMRDKIYDIIKTGFSDERLNVRLGVCNAVLILTNSIPYGTSPPSTATATIVTSIDSSTTSTATASINQDQRQFAISVIHIFADVIATATADQYSGDVRKAAMNVIKEVSYYYY